MSSSPIVIIGMHRSGTSILTRVLEEGGLFLGEKQERNNEALLFIKLNKWIFNNAGASWDMPHNLQFMHRFFIEHQVRVCKQHLKGMKAMSFLGWKNLMKYGDVQKLDFPFGWKDPRNTFTVDIWKEIFPNLKLIHIYRHPVDVCESLRVREQIVKSRPKNKSIHKKAEARLERVNYVNSLRVENLYEGFDLWKSYTQQAMNYSDSFGQNILHLKFEEVVSNPSAHMQSIFDFCRLNFNSEKFQQQQNQFDASRMYAFEKNQELSAFFEQIKYDPLVKQLGYDH